MSDPFDSPKFAIRVTRRSVDEFKAIIDNFFDQNHVSAQVDVDPSSGNKTHKLVFAGEPPDRARESSTLFRKCSSLVTTSNRREKIGGSLSISNMTIFLATLGRAVRPLNRAADGSWAPVEPTKDAPREARQRSRATANVAGGSDEIVTSSSLG